ncbi:hypothetical protein SAMN06265219_10382 [Gracilimonas mengyeensis]|uniref:Uncharacterized protein n=1 Tax=Gracilimonas mengyeensis TaxID=1302730 RepID=A0A521BU59_9BACT|nr:hypothetical protein SAMN06265219_10382 [Gracilimonas mengyeensis]
MSFGGLTIEKGKVLATHGSSVNTHGCGWISVSLNFKLVELFGVE